MNDENMLKNKLIEDAYILELLKARDESAIKVLDNKYYAYLYKIASNMIDCREDCEECINDTYMAVWNNIPRELPSYLSLYLAKILRNTILNKIRRRDTLKRGGNRVILALEEISEVIVVDGNLEEEIISVEIDEAINDFLNRQPDYKRKLFIGRYYFCKLTEELAKENNMGKSCVATVLCRMRAALKTELIEKGLIDSE